MEPETEPGAALERVTPGVLRLVTLPRDFRDDAENSPRMHSGAALALRNAAHYERRLPPEMDRMQQYYAPHDVFANRSRPDRLVLNIRFSSLGAMSEYFVLFGAHFPEWRARHFPLQRGRAYVSHLWCLERLAPEVLGQILVQTMLLDVASALRAAAVMNRVAQRWNRLARGYLCWVLVSLQLKR